MKLSIITINYNNCEGLRKTIDSVLSQTWKDFEWIVIDGGSTDGSRELIEQYQEHFAYWCSEPDKGVYNAMNKGIAKAKGEYLNFMNSGDTYYEAETLQKVFAEKRSADVVYGDCLKVYEDHTEMMVYPNSMEFYVISEGMICHQAMFIRSLFLKDNPYDESMKICADRKHLIGVALGGGSFVHAGTVICRYDMSGMSSAQSVSFQNEWDQADSLIPPTVKVSMSHLKGYAGSRHTVRARLLLEKGGLCSLIIKVVLACLDKLFIRKDFNKYPYCE